MASCREFEALYARALIAIAKDRGFADDMLCSALELDETSRFSSDLALERLGFVGLSRRVKMLLQDEQGGFVASRCRPGTFKLMAEYALGAQILHDGLERAFQLYKLLLDDVEFHLSCIGNQAVIDVDLNRPPVQQASEVYEAWWLYYWWKFSSWLIGQEIHATVAEIRSQMRLDVSDCLRPLACEWRFGQSRTRLVFPASFLRKWMVRDENDIRAFAAGTSGGIAPDQTAQSTAGVVQARLRAVLEQNQQLLSMDEMADEMAVSLPTLRRRLEREGTTYAALKWAVRREFALRLLRDSDLSISEIALRAGFGETSSLSRAVREWAGLSPLEYRVRSKERATEVTG